MSISVYQRPNKKWKADVELNGLRKTKKHLKRKLMRQTGAEQLKEN